MVMGILIERRTYTKHQFLGAGVITAGILAFNFSELHRTDAKEKDSGDDTLYGITLLLASIALDGVVGAFQGLLNASDPTKYHRPDALETMFLMNGYYVLYLFPLTLLSGQLYSGFHYMYAAPEMVQLVILFNLSSAAGQFFIFLTITEFSPLVCTTITTSRKFCSILLSVFRFGHILTSVQWVAISSVFFGLFLELCSKRGKEAEPDMHAPNALDHNDLEMTPLVPPPPFSSPLRRRGSKPLLKDDDFADLHEIGSLSSM
jgi:UDP-galactose transporter B1